MLLACLPAKSVHVTVGTPREGHDINSSEPVDSHFTGGHHVAHAIVVCATCGI
jgi:hypothetical protein